jgi:hypothetical protein
MKKLFFFICALSIVHCAFPQNPLVKVWDKNYGGTLTEWLFSVQQTSDGGYFLLGSSGSGASGNKTQPSWGMWDYWVVKTDSLGNKLWDKDFGGTFDDNLESDVCQTTDGGFILGGCSNSGISGDKTQPTQGSLDYWLVKIDSLGNKQWDKDLGGTSADYLLSIQQTNDGGFILGGFSLSGIGGDKTQANWDASGSTYDYWIVKTDSLGNKLWDKNYGGTDTDYLLSIQQTIDGGYILGGYSFSGSNGDKTQDNWDIGWSSDIWIVKTDSLGNKLWDKAFGGTSVDELWTLQQTTDGGYILGGFSFSGVNGDKTQPNWDTTGLTSDYWIIKIDSLGNKQWDKVFGGNEREDLKKIYQTSDGGYLLSGDSESPISGNKTEDNLGNMQTWIVKTDSTGNLMWEKTIITNGQDIWGSAIETREGCLIVVNRENGLPGGYQSNMPWGDWDYWIVKFCETLQANFTAPTLLCPGTCIDFVNHSFQSTSYQWSFFGGIPDTSTAINPTTICYANPGSYNVQLIASNSFGSDTLLLTNYITVYSYPPSQSILQNGDTLSAIAGAASYQWYFNGNLISGATDYFYVATQSGDYNVVATDENNCEVEAVINNVLASTQLAIGNGQLAIVPNPVTETLDVRGFELNSSYQILIYNVMGEKVFSAVDCKLPIGNCQLFPSGIYYIEILSDNRTIRTKFVKQ